MIAGELVHLRAREASDAVRAQRWWADPELKWLMGDRYDWPPAAAEASTRAIAAQPVGFGHLWFAIDTKDAVHIGNCRLFGLSAEDRRAMLGISIGEPAYRGRGYGTDAVRTLVRFAFEEMDLQRVGLEVFAYNERAIAAYRKAGFAEEARLRQARYARGAYHDVVVMAIVR